MRELGGDYARFPPGNMSSDEISLPLVAAWIAAYVRVGQLVKGANMHYRARGMRPALFGLVFTLLAVIFGAAAFLLPFPPDMELARMGPGLGVPYFGLLAARALWRGLVSPDRLEIRSEGLLFSPLGPALVPWDAVTVTPEPRALVLDVAPPGDEVDALERWQKKRVARRPLEVLIRAGEFGKDYETIKSQIMARAIVNELQTTPMVGEETGNAAQPEPPAAIQPTGKTGAPGAYGWAGDTIPEPAETKRRYGPKKRPESEFKIGLWF